jgi:hypothetical protein
MSVTNLEITTMRTHFLTTHRLNALFCACLLLLGCRGGSDDDPPLATIVSVPGVPTDLTANVGPNAISLGWNAPANTGGSSILAYELDITPTVTDITYSGTRALLRGLTTGVSYTISVRARNGSGIGAATPTIAVTTPQQVIAGAYTPISISGEINSTVIFDPSVLRVSSTEIWMSYSSVNYSSPGGVLTRDVGIRLARSTNGGATFTYQSTIAAPAAVTLNACGLANCQGRWVYETSWLIDDATDIAARRYKLFAHKYFLKPGNNPDTLYHLGAIVMWTASALTGPWTETSLLGWNLTPTDLNPLRNVNTLHNDLSDCLVVSEGSASVRGGTIDFVFACPYASGGSNPQKIVMLRTTDHANTFQYVSTVLTATEAAPYNYFSAPSLFAVAGAAPMLLVTPVANGVYTGCYAIPFSDDASGAVFKIQGIPQGIVYTPPRNNAELISGACAYTPGLGASGILQSNTINNSTAFAIHATNANLQP